MLEQYLGAMVTGKHVDFCLERELKESAEAGTHNFIGIVTDLLSKSNFSIGFREADAATDSYALLHDQEPKTQNSLSLQPAYHLPFWQIETTRNRWDWHVAKSRYQPEKVNLVEAQRFYDFWRDRLFGDAAKNASKDGFIFVPLQENLGERQSFQTCTQIEMLVAILQYDPARRVLVALDPEVPISPADRSKLKSVVGRFPRLEVRSQPMHELLQRCDYVVTQNSSVAFDGYFFGKPCVLFARSDFHHIAGDVFTDGPRAAFEQVQGPAPDFARYIWWFWQEMSINAGRDTAKNKIRKALRRGGWPL